MNPLRRAWRGVRSRIAAWAARRGERLAQRDLASAERWLRVGARLAPEFAPVHRHLVGARRRADDRLGAVEVALRVARRFDHSPDAWMLLGEAHVGAFRLDQAIVAYERALQIEERAEAAMAVGDLYGRRGDHATAGARYARAYHAGAGPDALRANAKALRAAGDGAAASEAKALWEKVTGQRWTDE